MASTTSIDFTSGRAGKEEVEDKLNQLVLIPVGSKICLIGKTGSGKSTLLKRMCEQADEIFSEKPVRIYFVYQFIQEFFNPLRLALARKNIEIVFIKQRVPEEIPNPQKQHIILAIDDLNENYDLKTVSNFFLRAARHNCITIIINFQSLFLNNSMFRNIMNNVDFIALFYMTKCAAQLKHFAYQIFADKNKSKAFIALFHKLTNKPNGCLILDLRQSITHRIRNSFDIYDKCIEFFKI